MSEQGSNPADKSGMATLNSILSAEPRQFVDGAESLPSGEGIFYPKLDKTLLLQITVKGEDAIKIVNAIDAALKKLEIPYPVQGYLNIGLMEEAVIHLTLSDDGTKFDTTNSVGIYPRNSSYPQIGQDGHRRLTGIGDFNNDGTACYSYDYEDGNEKRTISDVLGRNTKIPRIDPCQLISQLIIENLPPHMSDACKRMLEFDRFGSPRATRPNDGRFSVLNPGTLGL